MRKIFTLVIAIFCFLLAGSCQKESAAPQSLADLPADTGGVHTGFQLGSTQSPYGYFVYLPSAYKDTKHIYPLLVFLHGSGEKGNSETDPNVLDRVLKNGPPKLIEKGEWNPTYPMIVVSPQCHDGGWNARKIYDYIHYISRIYRVDANRIYLTGLSMGGFGTFNYLQTYGDTSGIVAAVPICGGGNPAKASQLIHTPLWIFHGDADPTVNVSKSIEMYEAITALNPAVPPKLTIYNGVRHDSWSRTYNGSGLGTGDEEYDVYDKIMYDWLFQFSKDD